MPALSAFLHRLFSRFWVVAGAVSVRTKILGIVLALVLALGAGATLQVRGALRSALSHELQNRGVSSARDVAAHSTDLILVHDVYGAHRLLQDMVMNNDDMRYAFIVSPKGEILAHTFGDGFPLALAEVNSIAPTERYHLQEIATDEGIIWDFAVPIFGGRAGVARVGLSEQAMQITLDRVTRQLLVTTVVVSLMGVVAATFLTWLITRPVIHLVEVTRHVARGDLTYMAPHWADDEIGVLSDSFNSMVRDLATARAESEAYNAELLRRNRERGQLLDKIITTQEEERKRIARELHDGTSQSLTSLMVGLRVLGNLHTPAEIRQHLASLRDIAAETLEAVHDLALELRPSVLDDMGLVAAVERYLAEYQRRFDIRVDSQVLGFEERRLPPTIETALYRIIQEALTNVARHAGATHASVWLEWTSRHVRAIVGDNGRGFYPATTRQDRKLGLYGMLERATLIGGDLRIESQPGASVYLDRQDDGRRPAKPLLWGDAGVRARQVYRQANLELAPGGMQVPDHLGVELQFLHHLCGREADAWSRGDASEAEAIHAQQVAFARDHLLVWLPEFYVRVEEANAHPFYRAVTRLLIECLRAVVGG